MRNAGKMSLSTLRQLQHAQNIPVVKAESDPMMKGLQNGPSASSGSSTWPVRLSAASIRLVASCQDLSLLFCSARKISKIHVTLWLLCYCSCLELMASGAQDLPSFYSNGKTAGLSEQCSPCMNHSMEYYHRKILE